YALVRSVVADSFCGGRCGRDSKIFAFDPGSARLLIDAGVMVDSAAVEPLLCPGSTMMSGSAPSGTLGYRVSIALYPADSAGWTLRMSKHCGVIIRGQRRQGAVEGAEWEI